MSQPGTKAVPCREVTALVLSRHSLAASHPKFLWSAVKKDSLGCVWGLNVSAVPCEWHLEEFCCVLTFELPSLTALLCGPRISGFDSFPKVLLYFIPRTHAYFYIINEANEPKM